MLCLIKTFAIYAFAALAILFSSVALAQTGTNAQVSGTISGSTSEGGSIQGTFSCTGTPTCTGQYTLTDRDSVCSNSNNLSGAFVMSGLNLSQSGAVQGLAVLDGMDYQNERRADGTCVIRPGTQGPGSVSYTGNWNLAAGTGTFKFTTGSDASISGTVRADMAAAAPVTDNTQFSGGFGGSSQGDSFQLTFSCRGSPSCAGQFNIEDAPSGCSNRFRTSGIYIMTGLNVAQSGSIQGMVGLENVDYEFDRLANGTCAIRSGSQEGGAAPYSGTWDATKGTGSLTVGTGASTGEAATGTVKADVVPPPPVFPIAVTSSITPTSASATAAIQFRPQDVGTSSSIYTFAVAPAALVKGGLDAKTMRIGLAKSLTKADPPVCVLAQLNSSGQLIAVTTAQLQAYLSGTLSAQGASVTILNNASTPAVAGATFYVGYGASSAAMLNNGVFRSAVTVPGTSVCPMLSSQTALWWNPAESGWGLNLNHQGNIVFGTLFTYDANRVPMWLVMSNGAMQSDGVTFTGDLYRTTGPAFNANPFTPIGAANVTGVGTMTVSFADVNSGTLRYTVSGVEVSKGIERQVYGTRAAACFPSTESRATATNYQDLWWNAAESGWGINITHQDNTLFATLFTYNATGRDLWLVMSAGTRQSDGSYLGDLYQTTGPVFNANPFTGVTVATVGTMRLRFTDGLNGTLTYTYNGTTVNKAITRQVFSSPVPGCS